MRQFRLGMALEVVQVAIHAVGLLPDIPDPPECLSQRPILPLGRGMIHIDGSPLIQAGSLSHRAGRVLPPVLRIRPEDTHALDQSGLSVDTSRGNGSLFGESHIPIVETPPTAAISRETK